MSELETLHKVQQLDTRIFGLRARMDNHPLKVELAALGDEERDCARELAQAESSLEKSGRKQAGLEAEIRSLEEKLAREEEKLYGGRVTNPKELRGLQAEVRSLKRQKDVLETELLEEMERQDEVRSKVEELRTRHRELRSRIEEKESALEADTAEMSSELSDLQRERDELSSQVGEELLQLYQKLLTGKQNLAVVKVIDGICQGCRVELPGKEYDRFLKSDGVFRCSNCGRILVK